MRYARPCVTHTEASLGRTSSVVPTEQIYWHDAHLCLVCKRADSSGCVGVYNWTVLPGVYQLPAVVQLARILCPGLGAEPCRIRLGSFGSGSQVLLGKYSPRDSNNTLVWSSALTCLMVAYAATQSGSSPPISQHFPSLTNATCMVCVFLCAVVMPCPFQQALAGNSADLSNDTSVDTLGSLDLLSSLLRNSPFVASGQAGLSWWVEHPGIISGHRKYTRYVEKELPRVARPKP